MAGINVEVTPRPVAPPAHSLLKTVGFITPEDQRWIAGITYWPEETPDSVVTVPCGSATNLFDRDTPNQACAAPQDAFQVTTNAVVSTADGTYDGEARVRRQLELDSSRQVAKELWRGTITNPTGSSTGNKFLADADFSDQYSSGAVTNPVAAMGKLEVYNGDVFDGAGLIHCTRTTLAYWASLNLVDNNAGRITNQNGTPVIADAGYTIGYGLGNTDPADASEFAYVTGPIEIYLSNIESRIDETYAPTKNDVIYQAWRYAAIGWHASKNYAVNVKSCISTEVCS